MNDSKEYNWYDIVNLIELSYLFKGKEKIKEVDRIIAEYSMDGINTWGIFVKFCYDNYLSDENECRSLEEFANSELEKCIEKFINIFFEEKLECNMCGADMKHIEYEGTHIWNCEECPNIQLEYVELADYTALGTYLLKQVREVK